MDRRGTVRQGRAGKVGGCSGEKRHGIVCCVRANAVEGIISLDPSEDSRFWALTMMF